MCFILQQEHVLYSSTSFISVYFHHELFARFRAFYLGPLSNLLESMRLILEAEKINNFPTIFIEEEHFVNAPVLYNM